MSLRDQLEAAGGPAAEEATGQGDLVRRIARLEAEVGQLRGQVAFVRLAALVAFAVAVGLALRTFVIAA